MRFIVLVGLVACSRNDSDKKKEADKQIASPAAAAPKKPTPHVPPIEAAIEQAKREHKPLVVEFYTSWCKPCEIFDHTTLPNPRVKAALGRVVFVRYDAEAEPGTAAASRYNVSSFPTFLAIDHEGTASVTQSGLEGDGVQQFLSLIDAAETSTLSEADLRKLLASKPKDNAVRLQAAHAFANRGKTQDALAQLDAVVSDAAASAEQRDEARTSAARLRRIAKWHAELAAEKLAVARATPAAISDRDLVIATVDSGLSATEVRGVIAKVLGAHDDPMTINGMLYVALAAGAKDEALAAAKRVLASSKDANLLDTLAECYHMHGDKADALRVEDQAIALAEASNKPALAANRARFAKGSGESEEVTKLRAGARELQKRLAKIEEPAEQEQMGSAMQSAAMSAFMAAHQLGKTAGAACASVAGKSKGAFARLALDDKGKVTSSTIFLDAGASEALRTCIAKQLGTATLPVVPGMPPQPIEITF